MTNQQVPEALRLAEQYDYGDPAAHSNTWKVAVCTELRRQHALIAELEDQLEAVGAGGVQPLSAAPAGWKLVPVEPTVDQEWAGKNAALRCSTMGEACKIYKAMLAASPTPPAEQQATKETSGGFHVWRDISTAPKDGSRFVATGHNYGLYSEVRHTCVAQWFRGCWMEASDWNETSELKYLTHWMPLPSPPDDVAAPAEQPATTEAATPKGGATTEAALGGVYAELPQPDSWFHFTPQYWGNKLRDFADRTHALRQAVIAPELQAEARRRYDAAMEQAAPEAAPAKAAPVKACVCGEPQAPGTVHRVDGPCYVAAPQQEAQEPATAPRFNCWSTNEGDSWFDHPADAQAIYDCLGNDAKVGDEYELTAGWKSVTARYRITEVVGDGEEYEVECISHPQGNTAPQPAPAPLSDEREAFESTWEKLYGKKPVLWDTAFNEAKMDVPVHSAGKYFYRDTQAAWKAWQARAALDAQGGKE